MTNQKPLFFRLLPLLLLIFIDSFGFFVVIPMLLKLFYHACFALLPANTSITVRNQLTGMAISLSMFSALIAAPFIGRASDKFGRKKSLLCCIGSVFLGFLLPIIGIMDKNIYFIFIGRILSGIGSASQPVAQASIADLCKKEERAIYLSFIALMMTLALIAAPLAGGFLADPHIVSWFTIKTPFEFALLLSVINLVLIVFFYQETIVKNTRSHIFSVRQVIAGLPMLIKKYHIGLLIFLFLCLELAWSQYYQSIPLFLHLKFHASTEKISVFNANMGIVMALGLSVLYPLMLRFFSVKNIMRWSVWLVFMALAICAVFSFLSVQWIFSLIIALFTGFAYVSVVTLISNKADEGVQGLVMGYLSAILYFAWTVTAFSSGFLVSVGLSLPLYAAAFFLMCGIFIPLYAQRSKL